jgi:nitrogen regulatory protein P-II 1
MKRIDAVIRPESMHECLQALDEAGVHGVTVYAAMGHGVQGGLESSFEGLTRRVCLLPKSVLVVVVDDHEADTVIQILMHAARSGHVGDGKVFVSRIDDAVRVRTGERGSDAL